MFYFRVIINQKHTKCQVSFYYYSPSYEPFFTVSWADPNRDTVYPSEGEKLAAISSDHNRCKTTDSNTLLEALTLFFWKL